MQALQQPNIERKTAHRKLAWKANFTQDVSRPKHTLVALLVRPWITCGACWVTA